MMIISFMLNVQDLLAVLRIMCPAGQMEMEIRYFVRLTRDSFMDLFGIVKGPIS